MFLAKEPDRLLVGCWINRPGECLPITCAAMLAVTFTQMRELHACLTTRELLEGRRDEKCRRSLPCTLTPVLRARKLSWRSSAITVCLAAVFQQPAAAMAENRGEVVANHAQGPCNLVMNACILHIGIGSLQNPGIYSA